MWKRILFILGVACLLYVPVSRMNATEKFDMESMGQIEIPKLDLKLPIYEGVSELVLEHGIGYMKESSYPGSGKGTHCLLAGHRGLPDKELFARLGEMKIGDLFYVKVSGKNYSYRVSHIETIRPEETDKIGVHEHKELLSLITCTPYGINTHRLIVTGERMEETNDNQTCITDSHRTGNLLLSAQSVCSGRNNTNELAGGDGGSYCLLFEGWRRRAESCMQKSERSYALEFRERNL